MIEEEEFFAWLDGELPPEEASRIEAEVAASPELSRKAEEHRAMAAKLKGAFGAIAAAPVPDQTENGRLVAGGDLKEALHAQLASAQTGQGPRIGLTYRDKAGAICRTFQDDGASGLACREGGDWRIRGLFQGAEGQASDYRMAAGPDPRLMDMVDESIDGEPFDQNQERAALQHGWR